ncbi:hypothetical protein LRP88_14547 [Fusarium phalaenopsidis]
MVLLTHQLSYILAGLSSAAVVFTAPTGPLPGNANSFAVSLAVYRPVRPQTPPPAQPNTNPANLRPPSGPVTPHTPYQKLKDDSGNDTDPPGLEPSVPSDSERAPLSTDRLTEKKDPSTKKDNDTPASDEEDASTTVLAQMPATFGAAMAVIAWMYA